MANTRGLGVLSPPIGMEGYTVSSHERHRVVLKCYSGAIFHPETSIFERDLAADLQPLRLTGNHVTSVAKVGPPPVVFARA